MSSALDPLYRPENCSPVRRQIPKQTCRWRCSLRSLPRPSRAIQTVTDMTERAEFETCSPCYHQPSFPMLMR